MSLSSRYNAEDTEKKWYAHWMEKGYFPPLQMSVKLSQF